MLEICLMFYFQEFPWKNIINERMETLLEFLPVVIATLLVEIFQGKLQH